MLVVDYNPINFTCNVAQNFVYMYVQKMNQSPRFVIRPLTVQSKVIQLFEILKLFFQKNLIYISLFFLVRYISLFSGSNFYGSFFYVMPLNWIVFTF